jgi:hypothetical protein
MTTPKQTENQQNEIEALNEKVNKLEKENESLKKNLNESIKSLEDVASYKVFMSSREMFLKWIGLITVALSVFGFVSLSNIIETIKNQASSQVTKTIVPQVSKDLGDPNSTEGKKIREKIVEEISKSEVINTIIEDVKKDVLKEASDKIKEIQSQYKKEVEVVINRNKKELEAVNNQNNLNLIATGKLQFEVDKIAPKTQATQEMMYYVVAGAEADKQSLKNEFLAKSKNSLGNKYDIRICSPKNGNKFSAVVLSLKGKQTLVSLTEAKAFVNVAKKDGFRSDTYAIRQTSAFFDGSMCELL